MSGESKSQDNPKKKSIAIEMGDPAKKKQPLTSTKEEEDLEDVSMLSDQAAINGILKVARHYVIKEGDYTAFFYRNDDDDLVDLNARPMQLPDWVYFQMPSKLW